jgi:branched-subunit amino acid aminotransferase/4-amino-4-deoxychorismate lyase
MEVWLNGQFISREDASVGIFDAGFQHAVGLFETMKAANGRIFRADAHLLRLTDSARDLLLTEHLRTGPLQEVLRLTLERNELDEARVRLTVTGGDLARLPGEGRTTVDPTILVVAQPPTVYPDAFFEQGVTAMIADGRDNPFHPMAGHKTLNYWPRILALQEAAARQAGEALWFTVSNHLSCGSVSNVFLVRDGVLLTPIARGEEEQGSIPSCVLPGITRAAICEIAEGAGLDVERRMLDIELLLAADEVFLTNSSWGVLPVVGVEKETIGSGAVGEMTKRLREGWLELVRKETGGEESDQATKRPSD